MPDNSDKAWLEFAEDLAAAAQLIAKTEHGIGEAACKPDGSDVTSADLKIQRLVAARIGRRFPDHALLAEEEIGAVEGMPKPGSARYCWIVDPLDGTRNFVRNLPHFSTSIALLEDGVPIVGVIREHVTGTTYAAARDAGGTTNNRPLHVSKEPLCRRSVITFQPDDDGEAYTSALSLLRGIHVRNFGSTAMHLAFIAEGAVDGAVCVQARIWDIAAGALLITEAGGAITSPAGASLFPFDFAGDLSRCVPFIAGSASAHSELLASTPLPPDVG